MASLGDFLPAGRAAACRGTELPAASLQQGVAAPGAPQHSGLQPIKVLPAPNANPKRAPSKAASGCIPELLPHVKPLKQVVGGLLITGLVFDCC